MTEIEEIARLEFDRCEVKVPPISPAEWLKRSEDEFTNYQFLAPILNLDSAELVRRIEASGDPKMWQNLAESFEELSDRMDAFHDLLEAGHARLVIALAHVATACLETKEQPQLKAVEE